MAGLDGYDVDLAACSAVLGDVDALIGELEGTKTPLRTAVDTAKTAVKGSKVPAALDQLWTGLLGANTEAAIQRSNNAHGGAGKMLDAYQGSNEQMRADALAELNTVPDVR